MIFYHKKYINWLNIVILTVIILGIWFRLLNIEKKVYWHDEVYTSLRISGYQNTEVYQQIFDGQIITNEALQKYQQVNSEKDLADVVSNLAAGEAQLPPLYFILTRFWTQLFGNSIAVTRSLSVLFGLLVLPCLYWLCLELFNSSLISSIAVALVAVSPFHVLYAQEARPYSLWTMTILMSSAALLRAKRLNTNKSWTLYTVTLITGLYSFLLTGLVAIGQGIYIAIVEHFRFSKIVINYLLASLISLILFLPWIVVVILNFQSTNTVTGWTSQKMAIANLVTIWIANYSRLFFDVNFDSNSPLIYLVIPIISLSVLIAYSVFFLFRTTPTKVWLFLLILGGLSALAFMLPDLIIGGRRSSISRYLIPSYLSIEIAVAYLLATKITVNINLPQKIWSVIITTVFTAGVVSCVVSSQADTWWTKKNSHHHPQAARIINQTPHPLLVSSSFRANLGEILSFSHLLDPKVRFQLVVEPNIPEIPDGFSDVFLFNPSKALRTAIEEEQKYKLAPAYQPDRLWRLVKE